MVDKQEYPYYSDELKIVKSTDHPGMYIIKHPDGGFHNINADDRWIFSHYTPNSNPKLPQSEIKEETDIVES